MPRKTWDTKADWDAAYDKGAEGEWGHPSTRAEVRLHYLRGNRQGLIDRVAGYYEGMLGPAAYNRRFVIVGGGWGFIADALLGLGFTNIVVVDQSAYVQAEKDNDDRLEIITECAKVMLASDDERTLMILVDYSTPGPRRGTIPIVDADISTGSGRTAVRQALTPSGNPQIVVTEDVMTSLEDAECIALAGYCQAWGGQQEVVHLVSTLQPGGSQDPVFNWKSLVDWKALIPGDTWIDARTGDVL